MKDPAFLFYSGDFMTGTMFFTDEQTGRYIKLLCAQHLTGHLEYDEMIIISKSYDIKLWEKFIKDDNGLYYNPVLEAHINKRKAYTESRGNNRKGFKKTKETQLVTDKIKTKNISKTYVNHMENENENVIDNKNKDVTETKIVKNEQKTLERFAKFEAEVLKFETDYPVDMLRAFINYWGEMNEDRTLTKYEIELKKKKTFAVKNRLVTWAENNNKWSTNNNTGRISPTKSTKTEASNDRLNDILNEYNDKG